MLNAEVPRSTPSASRERAREGQRRRAHELRGAPRTAYPFAKLARHPRMVKPVMQIYGDALYMHQFKINGKAAFDGDVWQWHQDYGTWKNDDLMPEPAR